MELLLTPMSNGSNSDSQLMRTKLAAKILLVKRVEIQNMKSNRPLQIGAVASLIIATSTLSLFARSPGDPVTLNALAKSEFVKGAAPTRWETNQVYILECWATWCALCVAAIPHVDGLYDKYHEKGLNVIGVNVFEDGKDKVAKFVAKKGDGMSYPVAYTGRGGVFEEEWLKPAGVNSIPHAFVVKNGKLLFMIHPASLNETMIENLLAGGEAEAAQVKKMNRAANSKGEIEALVKTFSSQTQGKEFDAAKATLSKIKDLDENYVSLGLLEISLATAQEKWDEVASKLKQDKSPTTASMLGMQIGQAANVPAAVLEALVKRLNDIAAPNPIDLGVKASLLARLGKKDEALAAAQEAAKAFNDMVQGKIPQESLDAYVKSYETDKPMGLMEMFGLVRAASTATGNKGK